MEEWKPIKGYEGIYEVSNMGRVRSLDRKGKLLRDGVWYPQNRRGQMMKIRTLSTGYKEVPLRKDRKQVRYFVHRLVALAFVEGYKKGLVVNHLNCDPSDNRACNLEWVTQKENTNHADHNIKIALYHQKEVKQLDKNGNVVAVYSCQSDAAKAMGISSNYISYLAIHKKPYKGYYFKCEKQRNGSISK